jgi:cytochrome c biogenesis factor
MNVPDVLPAIGLAASLGAVAATAAEMRLPASSRRISMALFAVAAVATLAAFLFLVSRFLAADVQSYEYVYSYTRADLDWQWRLAGTWTGREGSLLLWTAELCIVTAAVAFSHRRAADDGTLRRAQAWTRGILGLVCALFLAAVLQQSPFNPNPLAGPVEGLGLNPVLKSGFILIHPPMMFLAYSLATVPAAAALAHMATGTNRWSTVARTPSRLGWLLMTFALGLGAMWAYYTLGFGGYFAWDPVEVANLLPWLAYTVYLHAQLHHNRHGSYALVGPFLAVMPFLLSLFSTLSTRSGLWVSVHAFTDPTNAFNPDPAGRFLDILHVAPPLGFYLGLALATLAATLALWARRLSADEARWATWSRGVAGVLGAFAAFAIVAPSSAISLLMAAAAWAARGSVGFGLLGLAFGATAAAAAPLLFAAGPSAEPRKPPARRGLQRVHLRSLAGYAILVLGLALLSLFLFHMASVNGLATQFYEDRFPFLALPVVAGILVFQGHQAYGRARGIAVAAAAVAAGLAAYLLEREAGHVQAGRLLLLAIPAGALAIVTMDRLRRAATPPNAPSRAGVAGFLLWFGAVLDLLFWLNPPSRIALGGWTWEPVWPAPLLMALVAALALFLASRSLVGAPIAPGRTHLLVGALGAFYVAPVLAALAWMVARRGGEPKTKRLDANARARLHQVGVHGAHLALALALVAYAPSTYGKSAWQGELATGQSMSLAGFGITYTGSTTDSPQATPASVIEPRFSITRAHAAPAALSGRMEWEAQAERHYPIPATYRTWNEDLYVSVAALHVAPHSPCLATSQWETGGWIEAYQAGSLGRVCTSNIDAVRFEATAIPGIGLLWLALALGVMHMAFLIGTDAVSPSVQSRRESRARPPAA